MGAVVKQEEGENKYTPHCPSHIGGEQYKMEKEDCNSGPVSIRVGFFKYIKSYKFFIFFGYQSLIKCVLYKYLLSFIRLLFFYFGDGFLHCAKAFWFDPILCLLVCFVPFV